VVWRVGLVTKNTRAHLLNALAAKCVFIWYSMLTLTWFDNVVQHDTHKAPER